MYIYFCSVRFDCYKCQNKKQIRRENPAHMNAHPIATVYTHMITHPLPQCALHESHPIFTVYTHMITHPIVTVCTVNTHLVTTAVA